MNPSETTGYVSDIEQEDGPVLRLTRDPHKAIKFDSRETANAILDDTAFVHAYGTDHGIKSMDHVFIESSEDSANV